MFYLKKIFYILQKLKPSFTLFDKQQIRQGRVDWLLITSLFLFSLLILLPTKSFAVENENYVECKTPAEKKGQSTVIKYFCSSDGILKQSKKLFLSTLSPSVINTYDEKGRIVNSKTFKIEGVQVSEADIEHSDNGTYIYTKYSIEPFRQRIVSRSRKEMVGHQVDNINDLVLETWRYNQEYPYQMQYIDTIKNTKITRKITEGWEFVDNVKIITSRTFYEEDRVAETFEFNNIIDNLFNNRFRSFTAYNPDGSVKKEYSEEFDLNIEAVIDEQNIPESEKERRKRIYRDKTRPIVVIIDSGVDPRHPGLAHKFFNNPYDTPNDIDDDGDGKIDNTMGWYFEEYTGHSPVISERLRRQRLMPRPFSHGLHVSSIAMRNIESFALAGFMGDMSSPSLLSSASDFLNKFDVHFLNMSFGVNDTDSPMNNNPETLPLVSSLIKDHQKTLFFAAAGNAEPGVDIDEPGFRDGYPALFNFKNLMVVGALNTNSMNWKDVKTYKRAVFSDFGTKSVDVFAPGEDVLGADMGGGEVPESGTSMASPVVMNMAMKIKEVNPALSSLEMKELIMRSVTFIDIKKPLNCVSGGIINIDRAMAIAKMMKFSKKSIRQLNWEVRLKEPLGTYGEVHDHDYIYQIIELWNQRFSL